MKPQFTIRSETDADRDAITAVTVAAFKTLEVSNQTEHFIIEALRAAKALTVSLVAESDDRVVGHIAFSPVTISDGTQDWYGLGPVSVLPEYQRKGIGKALIEEGLSRLKDLEAQGCCLVGHPDYYRRFGFKNVPGFVYEGVPPEVFLALTFEGDAPQGTVAFHGGFKADGRQNASRAFPKLEGEFSPGSCFRCSECKKFVVEGKRWKHSDGRTSYLCHRCSERLLARTD